VRYKLLGRSGLRVSELCLGTMTFGEAWQEWRIAASREESHKIFDAFVAAGGNFIDTANNYNEGSSEQFIGEFIASERERFVLATKYSLTMRRNDPNGGGNHRKNLVQSLDASLRRLKTDYIDLYWLHAWDFTTPVDEVMRALDDLVRAGKVLYIGVSDTPAWIVSKANTMAELRGWTSFVGLQVQYSLVERAAERDLLPMARDFGIGVAAWLPLGAGLLTGKYRKNDAPETAGAAHTGRLGHAARTELANERYISIAAQVQGIADEIGRKPSQVALNWLRQRGVIPILGARTESQIVENLGCVEFALTAEQMQLLDDASRIERGFPHEFLEQARGVIFGDTYALIDNPLRVDG
jgi:aryl-alcohol dehydrogenase-like predicted oxidoreductase